MGTNSKDETGAGIEDETTPTKNNAQRKKSTTRNDKATRMEMRAQQHSM